MRQKIGEKRLSESKRYLDLSNNCIKNIEYFKTFFKPQLIITVSPDIIRVTEPNHFHVKAGAYPEKLISRIVKYYELDFAVCENDWLHLDIAKLFVKLGGMVLVAKDDDFGFIQL